MNQFVSSANQRSTFDRDDFERLSILLQGALGFHLGKSDVRSISRSPIDGGTLKQLTRAIDANVNAFSEFSQLLFELRDRYANRTAAATGHPAQRGDARSQLKLATLKDAADRSKQRADIRRAAEAALRRGDVSLASDCPHGHGKLCDWEGLPRCWTCGWPWKNIDSIT
jgi:hypothetical protein